MSTKHVVPLRGVLLALLGALALIALAGCGSSSSSSSSSSSTTAAASSSSSTPVSTGTSACGPKPGVAATGSPINIGTIDTHQPGTDFTDGPNMINAYFSCVNANGGVNGHPLKLFVELDQTNPAQITAAAHQLIQSDHVVAIDGVFDLLECTLDASYWKSLGIYEMDAGISPECWSTANSAAVNMGPRYSSDGAVQYAINSGARLEDRVRAVERPGYRLHRRGPGGDREGLERPDHGADRERADHGRQLGRAQARRSGGLERVRWCSTSPRPRRW